MERDAAPRRIWVVPRNDLESTVILELLKEHGERVLVTGQPWGASWAGLEEDIKCSLWSQPAGVQVLGVELAGGNPYGARNIDHHRYPGDDRYRKESSLEQVATVLGAKLDRHRELVAANDRGHIREMLRLGATTEEAERIRRADRRAQGLTADDEVRAEAEIAKAEECGPGRLLVTCRRPTSAHLDRLFGVTQEILLVGLREWLYSGTRWPELEAMELEENHWSGGQADCGYFGVQAPAPATRERIRAWFCEFGVAPGS